MGNWYCQQVKPQVYFVSSLYLASSSVALKSVSDDGPDRQGPLKWKLHVNKYNQYCDNKLQFWEFVNRSWVKTKLHVCCSALSCLRGKQKYYRSTSKVVETVCPSRGKGEST